MVFCALKRFPRRPKK